MKNLPCPPMGFNSWDCYGAGINEQQLLSNAEFMRDNLKQFGYEYVVCDIQWYEPTADGCDYHKFADLCMDEYSRLIPAENRFPSAANGMGFKPIADKIHSMGLKFGIHIMRGIPRQAVHRNTKIISGQTARSIAAPYSLCSWNTDMYGIDCTKKGAAEYYNSIFELYASWGVDFVKVDDICVTEFNTRDPYSARDEIELIHSALENCGREMVLSLSPGPADLNNAFHLSQNANMFRLTGDFWDNWDKLKNMFTVLEKWYRFTGNGTYPDPDMLPVGNLIDGKAGNFRRTNFTFDEQKTLLTLWSIFRAPLIIGSDLPTMGDETLKLLTNPDVIAIDRNSTENRPVFDDGKLAVWACRDENGFDTVALFNLTDETMEFDLTMIDFGFDLGNFTTALELWTGKIDKKILSDRTAKIDRHSTLLYRMLPKI